ncbi:MAG: hypothetical protein MUO26_10910 [Methanotrichaceae archaeon]|nr:hypothetical protein [Methanotrichaceae archaeon]
MFSLVVSLCIFLLVPSGMAADVPFVLDGKSFGTEDYAHNQLEEIGSSSLGLGRVPFTSTTTHDDTLEFPLTGDSNDSIGSSEKKLENISKTINSRVEPDNAQVRDLALALAAKHPGEHTIDQVCEIYSYLKYGNSSKKPWSYVDDPRGFDYFNYASKSLNAGDVAGSAGAGDCDDFAILMSSLVESIGGTTRIIFARNNSTGHAYAEVYLGQLNNQNSQVDDMIEWLEAKFNTDKIFTHIDTDTKDVWLNLDWSANHPGGPFYPADRHYVLWIRDKIGKTPLNVPSKSNLLPKSINLTPDKSSPQEVRTVITWTAKANDSYIDQLFYKFFLNGDPITEWIKDGKWVWMTTDSDVGNNFIEVRVSDEEHADLNRFEWNKTASFTITASNEKPAITDLIADKASPQEAGAKITWTAESNNSENDSMLYKFFVDGKSMTDWSTNNKWSWQTNDTYMGENLIEVRLRDGYHADSDDFDYRKSASFAIVAPKAHSRSSDILFSDKIFLLIIILGIPFYLIVKRQ